MTEFQRGLSAALFLLVLSGLLMASAKAETGIASFYGGKHHGRKMANGQVFNQWSDSCAHKTRKFGTVLTVTMGNRSVRCVVRDRGPFIRGRIVDLSVAGARELGLIGRGIGRVSVR
jgi:rare lipoprotein A